MVIPRLGCAYPRCPAPDASNLRPLTPEIAECTSCGRLMAACRTKGCQSAHTFNRPFVLHCRRCGQQISQTAEWEQARIDRWNLKPRSVTEPELVADFSGLAASSQPASAAIAIIRGALAVHHTGQYLALAKVVPNAHGGSLLWDEEKYPFSTSPDGLYQTPYTPWLLPGDRHLAFSCTQGLLVLDLWTCQGISAKDNRPVYRIIQCDEQSLVSPPVSLGKLKIGLLLKDRAPAGEFPYRWAVWDLSSHPSQDKSFKEAVGSPQTVQLPFGDEKCRCQVVGERVITFSAARGQWVWKMDDAAQSKIGALKRTWPTAQKGDELAVILDDRTSHLPAPEPGAQAVIFQKPRAEKFSWFVSVREGDVSGAELIKRYEINFDSLETTFPQPINLRGGAIPIGSAHNKDGTLQMYFRAGTDIWHQSEGVSASWYQGGLPQAIKDVRLFGPMVVSVGESDQGQKLIQLDSLHHLEGHVVVPIQNKLLSEPLLWYRWLFTVEMDNENRVRAYRRTVTFETPDAMN